jgi:protein-S-isoprenylcysteine O-methyltransferase Ste14
MSMLRLWALAVLLGSLTISGYYRVQARKLSGAIDRRREGGLVLAARAAGGLGAFGSVLAHSLAPGVMHWATFAAPSWIVWTGATLGLLVIPGTYWVFSSIGRNVSETVLTKAQHDLVQHGPYRWIRHPLYTVGTLLLVALGLTLTSWLVLLFALVAFVVFRVVVVPIEEGQLEAKFGDAYRRYKRRTGAMAPRLL